MATIPDVWAPVKNYLVSRHGKMLLPTHPRGVAVQQVEPNQTFVELMLMSNGKFKKETAAS
jgi:hypothetical protein